MPGRLPRAGDLLDITGAASVQFDGRRGFAFRVIRPHAWTTYDGWMWLDGYQLNAAGDATARRTVFVQLAGLIWIQHPWPAPQPAPAAPPARTPKVHRPVNSRPRGHRLTWTSTVENAAP